MAPIPNARVLFNSVPENYPVPGETTVFDTKQTIDLETVPLNGGFLVKTLVLSVDPYFRGRMTPAEKKSYIPSFQIGAPLDGYDIGVVLRSGNSAVDVGKYIYDPSFLHQEYTVFPELGALHIIEKHPVCLGQSMSAPRGCQGILTPGNPPLSQICPNTMVPQAGQRLETHEVPMIISPWPFNDWKPLIISPLTTQHPTVAAIHGAPLIAIDFRH
ncbi:chaperonin 10-like protein [Mycena latifolia]|nr:chaperonin 10-like protein [Mycena latifolia]